MVTDVNSVPFGTVFADHMLRRDWKDDHWGPTSIEPYGPIALAPAASALHYGQSIFEGLKVYHQRDGSIAAFRPEANAARFARSAARLAMPPLPVGDFLSALDELVRLDRGWVPSEPGTSLYVRPLQFASEPVLGVRPAREYIFVLFAFPAGNYFPSGVRPVKIWISEEFTRASPGGTGSAKCSGNYAASLLPQLKARAEGCEQVLYLDAVERRYVEELGGMNVFFCVRSKSGTSMLTPELSSGTILEGVMRDCVIQLARRSDIPVEERRIGLEEIDAYHAKGELLEAFACGTAAVLTPIGHLVSQGIDRRVADGEPGPVTLRLRQQLIDIQYGRAPDPFGWMRKIC